MGADAFVAYYGVKFTFSDEAAIEQLEDLTHPLILASKAAGLEYWWDLSPDSDVEYTLFIGIELAILGSEYDARAMFTDSELNTLMSTVRQGLQDAQIPEIPGLYMQLHVDQ